MVMPFPKDVPLEGIKHGNTTNKRLRSSIRPTDNFLKSSCILWFSDSVARNKTYAWKNN